MANILVINNGDDSSLDLLNRLDGQDLKIITENSISAAQALLQQYSFSLIVYIDNTPDAPHAFTFTASYHVPVLILANEKNPFDSNTVFPDFAFIDYLYPPLSLKKLVHKLKFLLVVGQQVEDLSKTQKEVASLQKKIADLNKSVDGHNSFLELMSRRDGLTGLYNRRHFNYLIKETFSKATASDSELSLVILNIDYFNEINKTFGQDFGDFVLNELSARLTSNSRKKDICFRLSGEDFAVLMPSTSEKTALKRAEELRLSSEKKTYDNGRYDRKVTVSIGIATLKSHTPYTHEEFINMADQALFLAKSEGRNRCLAYSPLDRDSIGTSEQNFRILKETVTRILDKTKVSTMKSLQLLAQAVMEGKETDQINQAQSYVQLISQQLGFSPPLIETFKNAIILLSSIRYLMHNEMINKKGLLSSIEREVIADFPYKLAQITELFDYFSGERNILLHHGENYDGTGYPEGLKGDEIPIGARIFSLANAVAAMNSERPYRKKLAPDEILTELSHSAGKKFDPQLVLKLIDVIEEKGILQVDGETLDYARKKIGNSLIK